MYISYHLSIGFDMPYEYEEMEKFKSENEDFIQIIATSKYILFQKEWSVRCQLRGDSDD